MKYTVEKWNGTIIAETQFADVADRTAANESTCFPGHGFMIYANMARDARGSFNKELIGIWVEGSFVSVENIDNLILTGA